MSEIFPQGPLNGSGRSGIRKNILHH